MKDDDLKDLILRDRVDFKCPCCNRIASVGTLVSGPPGVAIGSEVVVHEEPTCHRYKNMDPLAYLTWARIEIEKVRPN